MSYAQRQSIRASRTVAIAIVAMTQASLGYAIANSFSYTIVQKAPDGLKTFNVEEVKPPPPEPRAIPKVVRLTPPPVLAPPRLVRVDAALPSAVPSVPEAPPANVGSAPAPAPPPTQLPPPVPPIQTVPPRSATGDLQGLFRSDDYPRSAIEHREQGSVSVRLMVDVTGRVGACDVTSSSGSRTLDNASCQILQSRALFTPARDSSGNLTIDTVRQEIRWMLG